MKLIDSLNQSLREAFEKAGYDASFAKATLSSRPDLCEYQCNGAMALAKQAHKAPIKIAEEIVACIDENGPFKAFEACMPGFINLTLKESFLAGFLDRMAASDKLGAELPEKKTIMVDYGGANVAKPLHIGHLRSAIIGESIKRLMQFLGHEAIGDTHLGDWGTQFGLIIEELRDRKPDLPYFDDSFTGEYPEEAPFTLKELEEIYPAASARSKEDEAFRDRALKTTFELQMGNKAYRALWKHINSVSLPDLKRNYDALDVHFELWKAESDAAPYIPEMIEDMKKKGIAHLSEGALVIDIAEPGDSRELPPCLIQKSDGASLYATTDLGTLVWRMKDYHPDQIIYLADKRQELHYTSFFRAARKAGLVGENTGLDFIGFGTMNGKDGKPFKTRAGGVMRLEALIQEINEAVLKKMQERYDEDELDEETVKQVGLAAIKYGDLSNQATKDYNFDIDRFASFEGNTGPYILYTIVRIKSILRRAEGAVPDRQALADLPESGGSLKDLMKALCGFPEMISAAEKELAPHKICSYIYQISDAFNSFYHDTPILKEEDAKIRNAYLALLKLTQRVLETCIHILGFEAPEKM